MAISVTSSEPDETVSVTFYTTAKAEEALNYHSKRNVEQGRTVETNLNKILNNCLKAGDMRGL